jgi:hypothetical protein
MSKTQGTQTRHLQAAPNFSIDLNITFGTLLCNIAKGICTFITKPVGIGTRPDTERIHHQNNCPGHDSANLFDDGGK